MTCPCRTATFIFSVTTYLDLFFIILFCTFSFFQFFSFLALLSFSHFFYLNWRFMGFYLFCGYLVNFTLHTYQSVKWVTILSLLDNTRTAELEFRSFLQPSPIHMMPWTSVAGVIPPVSTAVASSCVPVTLYGVIHTFTTFFFPSSPLNFTIWDHSLIIAKSLFLFSESVFFTHPWKLLLDVEVCVQIEFCFSEHIRDPSVVGIGKSATNLIVAFWGVIFLLVYLKLFLSFCYFTSSPCCI